MSNLAKVRFFLNLDLSNLRYLLQSPQKPVFIIYSNKHRATIEINDELILKKLQI